MAEHVGDARSGLKRRQRERELGVHERVARAVVVVGVSGLAAQLIVGDDGVLRRLAAGRRNGQDHGDGKRYGVGPLRLEQLPHVLLDACAVGDGLRGVDDAAASDGDDPVDLLALAEGHALAHQRDLGVGAHAAKLEHGHARLLERRPHARDKTARNRGSAAVVDEHATSAIRREPLAHLRLNVVTEHEPGR